MIKFKSIVNMQQRSFDVKYNELESIYEYDERCSIDVV